MQDTKLFETILGIPTPWHVARVELKPEDERVDVWLECVFRTIVNTDSSQT